MGDLDNLIAAVESGNIAPFYGEFRSALGETLRDDGVKAFDGSLDAALRLHGAAAGMGILAEAEPHGVFVRRGLGRHLARNDPRGSPHPRPRLASGDPARPKGEGRPMTHPFPAAEPARAIKAAPMRGPEVAA